MKMQKFLLFLWVYNNLYNINRSFLVNFALALHFGIGYNVVTKVTGVAFGCHN